MNQSSGTASKDAHLRISESLAANGAQVDVLEIASGDDGAALVEKAVREGSTGVLACGGDGTVMAAVNGIIRAEGRARLAISPMGTGNLIALAFGIPSDPQEAVRVALEGKTKTVDLGRCGEQVFLLGLGVGLAERFVTAVEDETKGRLGRWAYAIEVAKRLRCRTYNFVLEPPAGRPVRASGVGIIVSNIGHLGPRVKPIPGATPDDGLLEICVLHRFSLWRALRMGWRAWRGTLAEDRAVTVYRWPSLRLACTSSLAVQIDGDAAEGTTPVDISVVPQSLQLMVPIS